MTNRQLEFILSIRDEATARWKAFVSAMKGDVSQLSTVFSGLGTLLTGVFSAAFAKSSLSAFMQSEEASNRLSITLRNQGAYTQEAQAAMENYAQTLQRTTTFDDEAILRAQALLISLTGLSGNGIKPLTKATLDLATGLGVTAEDAAKLIAKTIEGGNGLARYGIHVADTTDKMERIVSVQEKISEVFGGRAVGQLNTLGGKIQQLGNLWDDFKEKVGKGIAAPIADLVPALGKMLDFISKTISSVILGIKRFFAELFSDGIVLVLALNKVFGFLSDDQVSYLQKAFARGQKIISDASEDYESLWNDMRKPPEDFGNTVIRTAEDTEDALDKIAKSVQKLKPADVEFLSPEQERRFNRLFELAEHIKKFTAQSSGQKLGLVMEDLEATTKAPLKGVKVPTEKDTEPPPLTAWEEYYARMTDISTNALDVIRSGFEGAVDTMVRSLFDGAKNMDQIMMNLTKSILADLTSMIVKALLLKAVMSITGGAGTPGGGGGIPFFGSRTGGGGGGESIPLVPALSLSGAGGGSRSLSLSMQFNVSAMDAKGVKNWLSSSNTRAAIVNAIRDAVQKEKT